MHTKSLNRKSNCRKPIQYTNTICAFTYNKLDYLALCIGCDEDGKLICYRVRKKSSPKFSGEILVVNSNGEELGYVVEYPCKFTIPMSCIRKKELNVEEQFVKHINCCYLSLPPLSEQIQRYKEAKARYYSTTSKGSKSTRDEMNNLAHEINSRRAIFLENKPTPKTPVNKYSNYKITPNRDGISRVYSGGSCTGKK